MYFSLLRNPELGKEIYDNSGHQAED